MSPSLLYLKPLRNSNTFLHVIYKSKKKTNLLCILNNVFQYSKIRTRKRNAKKSIKTEEKFGIQPFLESGMHRVESRIHDCHGFPYMGRCDAFLYVCSVCLRRFISQVIKRNNTSASVLNIISLSLGAYSIRETFVFQTEASIYISYIHT